VIGSSLSHFKITAKLGEGGMGEVYRAEDTKLGREVAIKVLPEAVAEDAERLARFEREAKVLASLNHPQIAAIYSLESATPSESAGAETGRSHGQSEVHFLVMELVEGETLQERIARGVLPPDEAIPIAVEIAEAIEAAHEKGIIHRDLKPANIKLTSENQVKVLDFGLAKALDLQARSGEKSDSLSLSPTLTAQMTQAGVIFGTAAYMSPEQARGQEADRDFVGTRSPTSALDCRCAHRSAVLSR
jgi:serine/threonine-protein kinase